MGTLKKQVVLYAVPLACLLLLVIAVAVRHESRPPPLPEPPDSLLLLCDESLRHAAADIAAAFQRRHGIRVEIEYGTLPQLLEFAAQSGRGDVLLAVNSAAARAAAGSGLAGEILPVAGRAAVVPASSSRQDDARTFVRFLNGRTARETLNVYRHYTH